MPVKEIQQKIRELNDLHLVLSGQLNIMPKYQRVKVEESIKMMYETCKECLQLSLFDVYDFREILRDEFPNLLDDDVFMNDFPMNLRGKLLEYARQELHEEVRRKFEENQESEDV